MIRLSLRTVVACCLLAALFTGCRSITPPVTYYTLSALSGGTAETQADDAGVTSIGIRSVELPGVINRTQMVRQITPHRLEISSFHRWADYPDRLVHRILQQNLASLMSGARVYSAPWPMGLEPDVTISFQFIELIAGANRKMRLSAEWTITGSEDPPVVRSYHRAYLPPLPGSGYDDLAAAHSKVLETLCREVADTLAVDVSP